jgi:hypothetical protein
MNENLEEKMAKRYTHKSKKANRWDRSESYYAFYGTPKEKEKYLKHFAPTSPWIGYISMLIFLGGLLSLILLRDINKLFAFTAAMAYITRGFWWGSNYGEFWRFLEGMNPSVKDYRYGAKKYKKRSSRNKLGTRKVFD